MRHEIDADTGERQFAGMPGEPLALDQSRAGRPAGADTS
jgi:hypothetical protein